MPKVSIIIPVHNFDGAVALLERNLNSIADQTFRDYEIVISDDSDDDTIEKLVTPFELRYVRNPGAKGMANNTNYAIDNAHGELVKILFIDDYFADTQALEHMVKHFTPSTYWMAVGCAHTFDGVTTFNEHRPYYSTTQNTIGSPSVTMWLRELPERFDPSFHWVLDLDLYRRFFKKYGLPKVLHRVNVIIGLHEKQMTNQLTDERKALEFMLLQRKHGQGYQLKYE